MLKTSPLLLMIAFLISTGCQTSENSNTQAKAETPEYFYLRPEVEKLMDIHTR